MNSNWSYTPETLNSGRNWWFFVPCDLEIWWMTLENNRASRLYYIKLCASFQIHRWIETEVTVQKRSIWVNFLSCVTLKFDGSWRGSCRCAQLAALSLFRCSAWVVHLAHLASASCRAHLEQVGNPGKPQVFPRVESRGLLSLTHWHRGYSSHQTI